MWQNIYFKIIIFVQTRRRSIMPRAAGTFLAQILWHLAEFQPRIPSSPHSTFSPFITLQLPWHSTIAFLYIATLPFHCYCHILKICSCVSIQGVQYIVYGIVHIWVYLRERPNMTIYKVLKVLFCTSLAQLPMREWEIQKVTTIVFCEPCISVPELYLLFGLSMCTYTSLAQFVRRGRKIQKVNFSSPVTDKLLPID